MNPARRWVYFGSTRREARLGPILLTDTRYTHAHVDWHAHANAYFTLLLEGSLVDVKRGVRKMSQPGDLLFHPWDELHCNERPSDTGRGFHVEIEPGWFKSYGLPIDGFADPRFLGHPRTRLAFYRLHQELLGGQPPVRIATEALLLAACSGLVRACASRGPRPSWVERIRERLHEEAMGSFSLMELARDAGIHPVHLSRAFPRYFGINLGGYIRSIRVERGIRMMVEGHHALATIAYTCGFSDQSHMVRAFRRAVGAAPSTFLQAVARGRRGC